LGQAPSYLASASRALFVKKESGSYLLSKESLFSFDGTYTFTATSVKSLEFLLIKLFT